MKINDELIVDLFVDFSYFSPGSQVFVSAVGQSDRKGRCWEDFNWKVCRSPARLLNVLQKRL